MSTRDPRHEWAKTVCDFLRIPGYDMREEDGWLIVTVPGVQDVGAVAEEFPEAWLLATRTEVSAELDQPYRALFRAVMPVDVMVPAQGGKSR